MSDPIARCKALFEAARERLRNAASHEPAPEVQWCQCRIVIQSMSQESLVTHFGREMGSLGIIGLRPSAAGVVIFNIDSFEEDANTVVFLMHEAIVREQHVPMGGDSNWGLYVSKWREEIQVLLEFLDDVTEDSPALAATVVYDYSAGT